MPLKMMRSWKRGFSVRMWMLLIWSIVLTITLALSLYWDRQVMYEITGDEPHYLIITESLLRDGDVDVLNNYASETPIHAVFEKIGIQLVGPHRHLAGNQYSVHNPGISALVAPLYALWGIPGARITMVLLNSVLVLGLFRAARLFLPPPSSAILALAMVLGLPLLPASRQIYPDLLAGGIVLHGLLEVWQARDGVPGRWRQLGLGTALGLLPWLHSRFFLPLGLLLGAWVILLLRDQRRGGAWRQRLWLYLPPAVLVGLVAWYNLMLYGAPTGPHSLQSLSFDPVKFGMVAGGLHWDSEQGLFIMHPLLLLGLAGLWPLWRSQRWLLLLSLGLYGSILLPNAMHLNWYGGTAMMGRFLWAAAPLWILPLAALFAQLDSIWPLVVSAAGSLVLQAALASQWLYQDLWLYYLGYNRFPWQAKNFYTNLLQLDVYDRALFPSFQQFDTYLRHRPNLLALGLTLLLACVWLLRQRWGRLIWSGGVVVVMLLALWCIRATPFPLAWNAASLSSSVGTPQGNAMAAEPGKAGLLILEPGMLLPPGSYGFTATLQSSAASTATIGRWELVSGPDMQHLHHISAGIISPDQTLITTTVRLGGSVSTDNVQFRVFTDGTARLAVGRLTMVPLDPPARGRPFWHLSR